MSLTKTVQTEQVAAEIWQCWWYTRQSQDENALNQSVSSSWWTEPREAAESLHCFTMKSVYHVALVLILWYCVDLFFSITGCWATSEMILWSLIVCQSIMEPSEASLTVNLCVAAQKQMTGDSRLLEARIKLFVSCYSLWFAYWCHWGASSTYCCGQWHRHLAFWPVL